MRELIFYTILFLSAVHIFAAKAGAPETSNTAPQKEQAPQEIKFEPELNISITTGSAVTDLISVESTADFRMTGDAWYGLVSIQTKGAKVSVDEALAGLSLPARFYLEMGIIKNNIGIEDFCPPRDRFFIAKSPARELAGALGYRGTDPGIRLYRDPKSDPLELVVSVHLPDGNALPQTEIAAFYRFGSARKGRLGISASYLPLHTVDVLTGEAWQHDLCLSAGAADLSSLFRFLGEVTVGTVIERSPAVALLAGRPIPRWFLGADLQAGVAPPWDGVEFVPAIRASFLMPAVDVPVNADLSFSLGGMIGFQGGFKVHADGGTKVALRGGPVTIGLIWALNGSLDLQ